MLLLITGGLAVCGAVFAGEQTSPSDAAFVSWAREHAIALSADDTGRRSPLSESQDAKALKSLVGAARVVALGESAHGTHEPLAFRNRLFKDLVEKFGFTAIALESGLCESRRIYDFVRGGPGEATQVAREGFTWGFGDFEENAELIRWIRSYNAEPAHRRKVNLYGIDLSGGQDAELVTPRASLDAVLQYFERVAPDVAQTAHQVIDSVAAQFTSQAYRQLSFERQQALHSAIEEWGALFLQRREAFIAASSQSEYDWASRCAVMAARVEQALRAWPVDNPLQGVSPELYKVVDIRDGAMAENVQWVLQQEAAAGRVLLFAHNAHIMNDVSRGGIWQIYRQAPVAMGQHLRSALGPTMVIIGMSSASTGAGLPIMKLTPDGLDESLAKVGMPRFMVDLRRANDRAVNAWLDAPHPLSVGFVTEHIVAPRQAFDAFVYFRKLTPARKAVAVR